MTSLSSSLFMVLTFFCSHNFSKGAKPVFVKNFYLAFLNESSPTGTYVITVKANDPTPGHYVTYSLESVDNPANKDYFEINKTSGDITIAKTVDREKISQSFLKFEAIATDNAQSEPGRTRVVCQIFDINDNYPVFENLPYEVNVSEATRLGEVVLKVTASDRDTSADFNNEPVFRIEGGNTDNIFRIGDTNGEITLQKSLDYETQKIYHLNVTATDKFGKPSGNTNWTLVTVMVTNEDDNPAAFSELLYEVHIDKDFPKELETLRVHAEDQDSVKDPVFYSIFSVSDPDDTFRISNDTGSITVNKNLTQNLYNLIVMANSTHHLPAFALVKVFVGPMPNRTFETSVPENKANAAIFDLRILEEYFNVSDATFSIIGRNDDSGFAINSSSKEVLIGSQGLDREKEKQYSLIIELKSEGKHRGFAKLIVIVLDINDNAPLFKIPYLASVREDSRNGTVILTVTANDKDAGANGTVVYEIITGNEKGLFALNNQSGAITLARQLDYETAVQHVLNISASDTGKPQRQTFTDVIIYVTDVNDNSPVLRQRTLRVSLFEDTGIGSLVTEINATDADDGENGRVTYEIIAEDVADKFAIDSSTGAITTIEQLDREAEPQYTVVVEARDNGLFSRSDVGVIFVTVVNKNEHSPVISPLSYVGGVYKETSYYSLVTTIKATDADAEGIDALSYELINGNGVDLFHVESSTGHVRTITSMADLAGKKYTLTVGASDGGNPARVSTEKAIVDIFVLQDEDAINVMVGVVPQEITKNRTDFLKMLSSVTEGEEIFIKHLRKESGDRATLVTFHAVKEKQVMTADTIISTMSRNKNLLDITFKKWNVSWFQSVAQSSVGARVGTEEKLSATVGAMICFGVMMFVFGIILFIILLRRKRAGKAPFKRKRLTRVTFKEEPEYIDSNQTAVASYEIEEEKEAPEVIPHEEQADGSSLQQSDLGSTGSKDVGDVLNFANFGYSTMAADYSNEVNDLNASVFVPPPPRHPPPKPPSSDEETDEEDSEKDFDSTVVHDAFRNGYDERTEMFRVIDGVVVLSESPSDSITGSTEQLVNDYPKISFVRGSVLKQFPSDENTTEL